MGNYLVGSEKMFYDFVDSLSEKDKIGLVTHVDLDGVASAVFLQRILESRKLKLDFIKFLNYGSNTLKTISDKKFDVLFFTDFNADSYAEDFEDIRRKSRVLVLDHHPLNKNLNDVSGIIKTDSHYCSAHALFDLAKQGNYFDTKKLEWLACAAIISDYTWDKTDENFQFIKQIYPEVKKDNTIWKSKPAKLGNIISGSLIYYSPNLKKVYDLVLEGDLKELREKNKIVESEIKKWVKDFKENSEYFSDKKLRFYYGNPKFNIASTVASISADTFFRKETIVFASDFLGNEEYVKASARNQTGEVNLGEILKKCAIKLENADGGGHARAASATLMKKDLDTFKNNLLLEL